MDETNIDSSSDANVRRLQEEVRSLRTLLICALAVMLLFSACINTYLTRQARMIKAQVDEAEKVVAEFGSFGAPWANNFWNKLLDYSKTHPDFTPIIEKYRPYITAPPQNTSTNAPKKL